MGRIGVLVRRKMAVRTAGVRSGMGAAVHRRGRKFGLLILLCIIIGLAVIASVAAANLKAVTQNLAVARINYYAGKTINDAIDEVVAAGGTEYSDLILLDTDATGNVSALRTNMVEINRLKAEVTSLVIERINSLDPAELSIPLGNLFPSELFSGRGPLIPVILVPVGSVETNLESVMLTAGINQTRHRLILEVNVNIGALLPGFSTYSRVSSAVNVAETIIVGKVPNAYTYLEDTGQSGMDIYGDFDLTGDALEDVE